MATVTTKDYYVNAVLSKTEYYVDGDLSLVYTHYVDGGDNLAEILAIVEAIQDTKDFFQPTVASVTGTYNALTDKRVYCLACDASGGGVTINLPAASGNAGQTYHIKKTDSSGGTVTIDGNGSETIDGDLTAIIQYQYNSVSLFCDGAEWFIF